MFDGAMKESFQVLGGLISSTRGDPVMTWGLRVRSGCREPLTSLAVTPGVIFRCKGGSSPLLAMPGGRKRPLTTTTVPVRRAMPSYSTMLGQVKRIKGG